VPSFTHESDVAGGPALPAVKTDLTGQHPAAAVHITQVLPDNIYPG
jgi:hypothetical protein